MTMTNSAMRLTRSLFQKGARSRKAARIQALQPLSTTIAPTSPSSSSQPVPPISTSVGLASRSFSSFASQQVRSYPQYTVFGETCMLGMKAMMPSFKMKNNVLSVDQSKRGRIMFEWIPRDAEGRIVGEQNVRFALSVEECGLVLDQLGKNHNIVLTRRLPPSMDGMEGDDRADKVLYVTAGQGGMASFKVDFEINGIGGQSAAGHGNPNMYGPLEVIVQAGELQVILSLIRDSIPKLSGWSMAMDNRMQSAIHYAIQNGGTAGGGGYGAGNSGDMPSYHGGPRFSSSEPDTPF